MSEEREALSQTKPLADPVRVIALLMVVGSAIAGAVTAILCEPVYGRSAVLIGLALAGLGLSYALLIGPVGKPNAIYLRAFRTDRSTAKLRAELSAILGSKYRLSGIRPPKEKTSMLLRFLVPGLVALRYAGSKFMELEAGDDWMVRLWKTYQSTRLVFIDVRDVTVHVHDEIQMTMAAMGAERCIFVTGPGKSPEEWRTTVASIAGPNYNAVQFQLLDASDDRIRTRMLEADLKAILKSLPPGLPGHMEHGREFIEEHVPAELIRMSQRTSPMNAVSAVVALAFALLLGYEAGEHYPLLLLPLIVPGLLAVAVAMFRAMGRIGRLASVGHVGAALRMGAVLAIAALPFVTTILALPIAIPNLVKSKKSAEEVAAIANLRTLETAELTYSMTYGTGYACQLSQLGGNPQQGAPTAQAAQLIDPVLGAGVKSGYRFAITNCKAGAGPGGEGVMDFVATATPDEPDGRRGFCLDSSGVTRFDPNGGTNCAEALQY